MGDQLEPQDPKAAKKLLVADAEPTSDEDLFIVAGLGANQEDDLGDANADLVDLMAAGPPEMEQAPSPVMSQSDLEAVSLLARGEEIEVELGAAAGEVAAVLPPQSEADLLAQESQPEAVAENGEPTVLAPVHGMRAFRPWVGALVAASIVFVAGAGTLYKLRPAAPVPVGPVARAPQPSPAQPAADAACAPAIASSIRVNSRPRMMPAVAQPFESADAPAVADASSSGDVPKVAQAEPAPVAQPEVAAVASGNVPNNDVPQSTSVSDGGVPSAASIIGSSSPAPEPAPRAEAPKAPLQGAEVVVRLKNGNFFGGKLSRFTDEGARLKMDKGELNLSKAELDIIVPVAQGPKSDGPEAVICLENGNRIAGRLIEESASGVLLSMGSARVRIAKHDVKLVELRSSAGLILETAAASKSEAAK